ncbi:MAG: hypothetical protein MJ116_12525 [Lachnospiraceae bacterium]|nr:hypothetical protein [Lachnospiraceae bacterium]
MKKRMIALVMAAVLVAGAFSACGSNKKAEEKTNSAATEEAVAGGTENAVNEKASLPDDLQQVFDDAAGQFNGLSQQAVAYLGSQVVAGVNHAFLTQDIDGDHNFHVMIAYVDLEGNVELKSVSDVDPSAEGDVENADTAVTGGWTVAEQTFSTVPAEAKDAISAAVSEMVGISILPVALLDTQVVAGRNYSILCKTAPVVPNATECFQIVHVYQDLSDHSEITEYVPFSIADFNQ